MVFRAAPVSGISIDEAQFYPEVESARVGIAAIQRLLQKPDATVGVTYRRELQDDPASARAIPASCF